MKIVLEKTDYELLKNYKEAFNLDDLTARYEEYFNKYDYILGDYAYGKLRLKGFYKNDNPEVKEFNNFDNVEQYLNDYCAYDCKYYVIVKK